MENGMTEEKSVDIESVSIDDSGAPATQATPDTQTNPEIEKVFHGCDYDIVWLSYNFGVYVVNCIV